MTTEPDAPAGDGARPLAYPVQAAWVRRNPIARAAHLAVQQALRRGRLTRQPCEVCGAEAVDAHHPSYAKPLAVRWLCRRHHKAEHARLVREAGRP